MVLLGFYLLIILSVYIRSLGETRIRIGEAMKWIYLTEYIFLKKAAHERFETANIKHNAHNDTHTRATNASKFLYLDV